MVFRKLIMKPEEFPDQRQDEENETPEDPRG